MLASASSLGLVPAPRDLIIDVGEFAICRPGGRPLGLGLRESILGLEEDPSARSAQWLDEKHNRVSLVLDPAGDSPNLEAYEIVSRPRQIQIRACTTTGLRHGVTTLMQLAEQQGEAIAVPLVQIRDAPRFPWRGSLLDACRHFMSVEYVKRYVELLAAHKMNVFHWHLCEDQGWRIAIDAYPRLVEVAAWRPGPNGQRYGGFYSKDDVREVVLHAWRHGVTVVPEIELPGHCRAALAAHPELSCTGGPFEVETEWGIFDDVYCAGNDAVFTFLETVLDEVIDLFPSTFVHIGGDEVPKSRWRACPKCQRRMRVERLANEDALQSWFVRRIGRFLAARGKRLVGWDEILAGGDLPAGAVVQSWRGMEGAAAAAGAGHDTISSPTSHCYFDYSLDRINLRQAYTFDPVPPGLPAHHARHVIGGEFNMWSERAPQETVDGKVWPRALAIAERLWTGTDRTFEDFHARVQRHYARLDALGVRYGRESA